MEQKRRDKDALWVQLRLKVFAFSAFSNDIGHHFRIRGHYSQFPWILLIPFLSTAAGHTSVIMVNLRSVRFR
jgi:hypothetical protein